MGRYCSTGKNHSTVTKILKIQFILILDGGEDERTGARARRELTSNIKELFRSENF